MKLGLIILFGQMFWYASMGVYCLLHPATGDGVLRASHVHGLVCFIVSFCCLLSVIGLDSFIYQGKTVQYVRYMEWTVCSPLMVLEMCMASKASIATTFSTVILTFSYCLCGAISVLAHSLWFKVLMGIEGSIFCVIVLQRLWRMSRKERDKDTEEKAGWINLLSASLLWPMFVLTWGLGPDVYGVLDSKVETWVENLMSFTLKLMAMTYTMVDALGIEGQENFVDSLFQFLQFAPHRLWS